MTTDVQVQITANRVQGVWHLTAVLAQDTEVLHRTTGSLINALTELNGIIAMYAMEAVLARQYADHPPWEGGNNG